MTTEQRGRYGDVIRAVISQAQTSVPGGAAPEEAARVIANAIASLRPRTRYTIGRYTAMLARLVSFLPDRMMDRLLAQGLRAHFPKLSPA